ncbi:unnamed protein product [Symbiodinium sp. KB8]|nr:unnamed protein product [Symbiodinium sp. KB8]
MGLVRGAQFSERERKQSRVLSVKEIEALEEALAGHSLNKIDRYAVGVFLFQVYTTLEEARPFFNFQASSDNPEGHQVFNDEDGADWGRDHEEAEFSEVAADSGFASGLGSWSECDPPLSEEGFRPESSGAQGQSSAALNNPEDSSESDSSGEDTADDEDRKYEVLSSAPEIEKLDLIASWPSEGINRPIDLWT